MAALTQLKERYSVTSQRNGLSPSNTSPLQITENGEFRNSGNSWALTGSESGKRKGPTCMMWGSRRRGLFSNHPLFNQYITQYCCSFHKSAVTSSMTDLTSDLLLWGYPPTSVFDLHVSIFEFLMSYPVSFLFFLLCVTKQLSSKLHTTFYILRKKVPQYKVCHMQYAKNPRMSQNVWSYFAVYKPACNSYPQSSVQHKIDHIVLRELEHHQQLSYIKMQSVIRGEQHNWNHVV